MIKEVTVYEASDGERYDSWAEAIAHQFTLDWSHINSTDVIIKDKLGSIATYEYWLNNFDSAFYVEIKTPFGLRFIDCIAENCGVETLDNLGRYRWDEEIESWISFEEDFKRFNENWNKFMNS